MELNLSITEIDNGYLVHTGGSTFQSLAATNRAFVGSKDNPTVAEEFLQFVSEEILFKLMGRSKHFGGNIHGRVKVEVSFTEDPDNPVEMH